MTHYRNGIILATVVLALIAFTPFAQADPPPANQSNRQESRITLLWRKLDKLIASALAMMRIAEGYSLADTKVY